METAEEKRLYEAGKEGTQSPGVWIALTALAGVCARFVFFFVLLFKTCPPPPTFLPTHRFFFPIPVLLG